jgi:hypothetical protein
MFVNRSAMLSGVTSTTSTLAIALAGPALTRGNGKSDGSHPGASMDRSGAQPSLETGTFPCTFPATARSAVKGCAKEGEQGVVN